MLLENFSGETNIYLNCDVNDYYDGDEALIDRISRILDKFAKICVPNKPQKVSEKIFFILEDLNGKI